MAVAHLDPPSCCPDNGGRWKVKDVRWLLGQGTREPRAVRFTRAESRALITEFHGGDQILLACEDSESGTTFHLGADWRSHFVEAGLSVGLGVSVDSIATLYELRGGRYVLARGTASRP